MPTISPARTTTLASSTPGAVTPSTVSSAGASGDGGCFAGNVDVSGRPSIASTSDRSVSRDDGAVRIRSPSRSTVTVSESSSTSPRKWEIRTIVVPPATSERMLRALKSFAESDGDEAALS